MSMNLFFQTTIKGRNIQEDFPFQTSTELTYRVMAITNREDQIKEIENYIRTKYEWEEEWIETKMDEIKRKMINTHTKMEMS